MRGIRRPASMRPVTVVVVCVLALAAAALAVAAPIANAVGPHNGLLAVQVGSDGKFNIGAAPAADGTATADSWDLSYRWDSSPWSAFTTVRVDGVDHVFGGGDGTWVKVPTDDSATSNSAQWKVGSILVTQTLSLVANSATGQQDVARIAYKVANQGSASHSVGVRVLIDTEINYNDAARFRVPGVGSVLFETELTGDAVPKGTYVFDTPTDTTHIAFAENGFEGPDPDRMVFARWAGIVGTSWDYAALDPTATIDNYDTAYALYWNPRALAGGASRTVVSSYGLGGASSDLAPPLALGVYGPSLLNVLNGSYAPNPFAINAWVSDVGTGAAANVTAEIVLPPELSLAAGSPGSVSLGSLAVSEEKQASWQVVAAPQTTEKVVTYEVTVSADGVTPKTVARKLTLPVIVRPKVTLTLAGLRSGTIATGKKVTCKGKVTPLTSVGDVVLTVQKKRGRTWTVAKTMTVASAATGSYSWKYKVTKAGTYRVRAVAAGGAARSAWRSFRAL